MTPPLTRDPAAYRRVQRARAIERAVQIRRCYEEYSPPQIAQARSMMTCLNVSTTLPVFVGRGISCLTAAGETVKLAISA